MTCIRGVIASIVWNPHTHRPTYRVELLACPAPSRRRRRLARPLANHVFGKLSIFSTDNVRSLVHWFCFFSFFFALRLIYCFFFSFPFCCNVLPFAHSLTLFFYSRSLSLCVTRKFTACASSVSFLSFFQFVLCSDSVFDLVSHDRER